MDLLLLSLGLLQPALPVSPPTPALASQESAIAAAAAATVEDDVSPCDATGEDRDPLLGEPLCVNGVRIPDMEIKRYLVYDVQLFFPTLRLQTIMDNEVALMKEAGEDVSHYTVTDAELEKRIQKKLDEFDHNYPELERDVEIRRAYGSEELFREQMKQTLLFDKVFLPPNPEEWPALTTEAVRQETGGDFWIEDARRSYARRKNTEKVTGELPPEDETYMRFLRDIVIRALNRFHETLVADDGLVPEVALVVGEKEFKTEDLYQQIRPLISNEDVRQTKRWLASIEAAKQKLAGLKGKDEEGNEVTAGLTEEEFMQVWLEFKDKVQASTFNLESTVVQTQGFASVAAYRDYYWIHESVRRLMRDDLSKTETGDLTDPMRAHLDIANRSMGIGYIDSEMILCSAFDFENFGWVENGWEKARAKAESVKQMLDDHQAKYAEFRRSMLEAQAKGEELATETTLDSPEVFWTKVQEDHSEFWDPPPPKHGKQAATGYKSKGRFGEKTRNDLARLMGENHYYEVLFGDSVTDYVFYEQIPGTIAGPFRGPHGYYITKVKRRKPPTRPLNLGNEKHFEMLATDFLRAATADFVNDAFDEANVRGLQTL